MNINEVLASLGLKPKETKVYLSALELGQSSAYKIAQKAKLKRPTVYDLLQTLLNKGLVGQTTKGKKRLFYAEEPDKLQSLLKEKENKLAQVMPQLKSLYNIAGEKPKIRYYEGKEGLRDVYRDTLSYSGQLDAFVTENILKYLGESFADEYREKRKKAKLFARVIGPDTAEIKAYKKSDKASLKQTKLVPKKQFPFTIEMNIYGNKLAFMSFKEQMGVIIESNEIANNMRLLFELAWKGIK